MITINSSIVLTGFMGTGKTSVGRFVARMMGRDFVDMDSVIQVRQGASIREVFEARGEIYFRSLEGKLCAELGARDWLVVATGGGTLVNEENQRQFADAFIVCLDASVDVLVSRLDGSKDRPLLYGENVRERLQSLLDARRAAYARISQHLDTTNKDIEQVADEVVALFHRAVE